MATSSDKTSTGRLIFVPTLITLIITLLRVYGELHNWPAPWFSRAAGGGGALIGISWLPVFFGPYFAVRLARAGDGPSGAGKAIGFALLGAIVWVGGAVILNKTEAHPSILTLLGLLIMFGAAFIPASAWGSLGRTLFAYAFAARIPVLIVMFIAMQGNGGQGWGTHYDVVPASFASRGLWVRFVNFALLPQMLLWIGYTVVVGAIFGGIAAAVAGRRKPAAQPAAS
ncbi:MAG TPA: hypothetical protein VGW33_14660 [Terriglobia bacterium]|nr:hypothetical protein [Terriglobia bacterium]